MNHMIVQHGSREHAQVDDLRERVLRKPLGITLTEADRNIRPEMLIFATFDGGAAVASLMLDPLTAANFKLRQMCVEPSLQKGGLGRALVVYAEDHARHSGFREIEMSARLDAAGFYEKLGYAREGDIFDAFGIQHVKMTKTL